MLQRVDRGREVRRPRSLAAQEPAHQVLEPRPGLGRRVLLLAHPVDDLADLGGGAARALGDEVVHGAPGRLALLAQLRPPRRIRGRLGRRPETLENRLDLPAFLLELLLNAPPAEVFEKPGTRGLFELPGKKKRVRFPEAGLKRLFGVEHPLLALEKVAQEVRRLRRFTRPGERPIQSFGQLPGGFRSVRFGREIAACQILEPLRPRFLVRPRRRRKRREDERQEPAPHGRIPSREDSEYFIRGKGG